MTERLHRTLGGLVAVLCLTFPRVVSAQDMPARQPDRRADALEMPRQRTLGSVRVSASAARALVNRRSRPTGMGGKHQASMRCGRLDHSHPRSVNLTRTYKYLYVGARLTRRCCGSVLLAQTCESFHQTQGIWPAFSCVVCSRGLNRTIGSPCQRSAPVSMKYGFIPGSSIGSSLQRRSKKRSTYCMHLRNVRGRRRSAILI